MASLTRADLNSFGGVSDAVLARAAPFHAELNKVVHASGERIEGSLVFEHNVNVDAGSAPHTRGVQKRDLYVGLARRAHRMLEVGFNAGHSATMALIANPALEYHALDLCQHNYTRRCFQLLTFRFPGRVSLTCGDSTVRLRELELERWVTPRWRPVGGGARAFGRSADTAAAAGSGKANGRRAVNGYDARGYDLLHIDGGHVGKGVHSGPLHTAAAASRRHRYLYRGSFPLAIAAQCRCWTC